MSGRASDEAFPAFAVATLRAIDAFAERELALLARRVRDDVRQLPPSGLDCNHAWIVRQPWDLWDEFCLEVESGPSELQWAWDRTIQPFVALQVAALPHTLAVLLTIAAEWAGQDFDEQSGSTRCDDLISTMARRAVDQLARDEPPPLDGQSYCRALAERLEMLITEAADPEAAMDELAKAAERGGLIDIGSLPRRDDSTAFVMDLLTDNPAAADWMNCQLEWMKPPHAYEDVSDVAGHLL